MKKILFLLTGFSALLLSFLGVILIGNPEGTVFHLSAGLLEGSPFKDYRMPGLLFTCNGSVYLFSVVYHIKNSSVRYSWAIAGGFLTILILLAAILFLNPLFLFEWGVLIMGLLIIFIAAHLKGKWIV